MSDLGVVKILNMKWIISRQIPDSPPPQQGASDFISGLTGSCVYLFYTNLFPSQINIIPPKKTTVMPPLKKKMCDIYTVYI